MDAVRELLVKSGYSNKAIEYYLGKVNVGSVRNPSVNAGYTGPCGDTMEVYLQIKSNVIRDAKFQAIGCAGAFSAGAALMEMVKGRSLEEAEKITEAEVIKFLGCFPKEKNHCVFLARKTFQKAIQKYRRYEYPPSPPFPHNSTRDKTRHGPIQNREAAHSDMKEVIE